GRRRAASSGSSDEEPQPAAALPPAPGPDSSDSEREAEPEEGEGDHSSGTTSPEGARAADAAAEGPLSPEEPAGSRGEESEEFFKIKKPSFNEVTFRIQKKESLLPAQTEIEESKKICQLEPRTDNTKATCEEEEEKEDESYSSLSEDYNSSDSENESSSPQRRKDLSPGNIPSAACIDAARRKRHLARTRADYLPLDVSDSRQVSWRRESSDLESEDESDRRNLNFVPKMRTLRQRMTEHMGEFVPILPVVV
ncbi:GCFC2 factor, partial [Himantopus himantopus]|nr:GCFC2 factor [Himantopus himantopus]